jgi:hypothetical protein
MEEHAANRAAYMEKHGLPASVRRTRNEPQYKHFGPRAIAGYGTGAAITAKVEWDDSCGNGVNSFSVTANVTAPKPHGHRGYWDRDVAGGCMHDEIAKAFPEIAHLIKWHLVSADGPMHYLANVRYFAGDRDYHGKRKGEPWAWDDCVRFGKNPIAHKLDSKFCAFICEHAPEFDFEVIRIDHEERGKPGAYQFAPKFTFGGFGDRWHECPFDSEEEALAFLHALRRCEPVFDKIPTQWAEGKARELEFARSSAIWPDITDAELIALADGPKDEYERAMLARLPALMAEFKRDVEALGFTY